MFTFDDLTFERLQFLNIEYATLRFPNNYILNVIRKNNTYHCVIVDPNNKRVGNVYNNINVFEISNLMELIQEL